MNIALPALVVFVILLPGFIARVQIKHAERTSLDYSPFGQTVSEAVVWAGLLHVIWIWLSGRLLNNHFQSTVVLELLSSSSEIQARALRAIASDARRITVYFTSLIAFAYVVPRLARRVVIQNRWDRTSCWLSPLLRFSRAPWYYILSGADFEPDEVPDLIIISAIVNIAGQPYLYRGVLDDYFFADDGTLDRLVLQRVHRRPLSFDKTRGMAAEEAQNPTQLTERFYPIDGDYFVLRYSEAITLNVLYVKLEEASSNGAPA